MLSSMWNDWNAFDNLMRDAFEPVAVRRHRNDSGVGYEFDMPGCEEDSLEITFESGVLTVKGERSGRTMIRSITVPRSLDWNNAEANYRNGVLRVAMPLSEEAKPRRIEIKRQEHKELTS